MCTRFSLAHRTRIKALWDKIKDPKRFLDDWPPGYNIAPTDESLVLINQNNEPTIEKMSFGLIPHWSKDPKIALHCLNARAETITEKPSFREPFKKSRCIVLTDGFFEWKREGKVKTPYLIRLKNQDTFAMAGIWDKWKRSDGRGGEGGQGIGRALHCLPRLEGA